ncbi:MAG: TIGR03905 family TSCPD domain-containing protein [Clostridia bacterium]|nr:TIGR03905 family TSCPD domain-containing protein [Clostridia bacterium]
MTYTYITRGVCSRSIDITVNDGIIEDVKFTGGCNGNLKGISALVKGMNIDDVILKLKDIKCGFKDTSCPAQLAIALQNIKDKQ